MDPTRRSTRADHDGARGGATRGLSPSRATGYGTDKEDVMIVEYIRYSIPEPRRADFERAYGEAASVLDDSEHCLRYEVSRGVEEPANYVVRIEWDSIEGHEQGFRRSPGFRTFFALVRPFFDDIEEMRHSEATPVRSDGG